VSALTTFDREILREIAEPGSVGGLSWGAAMGVSLEWLQGQGYVTRGPFAQVTDKGREALAEIENSEAVTLGEKT
jgi:hypothetical protein